MIAVLPQSSHLAFQRGTPVLVRGVEAGPRILMVIALVRCEVVDGGVVEIERKLHARRLCRACHSIRVGTSFDAASMLARTESSTDVVLANALVKVR